MPTHPHLANAPITEALVDLQVTLADDFNLQRFEDVARSLASQFPTVEPIAIIPHDHPVSRPRLRGYLLRSADRLTIAQFRLDGFALNRLRPYTSWRALRPQALALWNLYRNTAQQPPCTRIALRYINQIDVVLPDADLSDYFTLLPGVPRTPGVITEFFSRVVLTDPRTGLAAALTQSSQPSPNPNVGTIWLDIDAYRAAPGGIPDLDIERTLDALHTFKNDLFFGSITEATVNQYR